MKHVLYFIIFSLSLFSIHQWLVLPYFNIEDTIPVYFQHILLGGFSLIIFLVANFGAKHYPDYVGFGVLGFLTLKMIFVTIFVNSYEDQIIAQPNLKYVFLGLYFLYLSFLLLKIVPLMNKISVEKKH